MANVEKIHEVKLPDDVLRYSINSITQALNEFEETDNNRDHLRYVKAGLTELLAYLTPNLED